MANLVQIWLADEEVTFSRDDVLIREKEHGIAIDAKPGKELGYRRQFFPWSEIRRVKELDDNGK